MSILTPALDGKTLRPRLVCRCRLGHRTIAAPDQGAGMPGASRDCVYAPAQPYCIHRDRQTYAPVCPRAIPQLAVGIPSPALDAATAGQGAGVPFASRDRLYPAAQSHHIHRGAPVRLRAVSQLAEPVSLPST